MQVNDSMEITLRQMDLWYRSALGSALLDAERAKLDKCLPEYFGQHFLQIGGPSETFLFHKSPILHRMRLSPEFVPVFRGPSIQGNFHELPFLSDSVDVVLLPHVLEFDSQPQKILQEIYTALVPEGHVLILGFNPYSLWGLNKYLRRKKTLPWRGHFRSAAQVCRWLKHMGFTIEEQSSLFFRVPYKTEKALKKNFFLEAIGRLLWPSCGAVYFIIAKKTVTKLMPIGEVQSCKPASLPA